MPEFDIISVGECLVEFYCDENFLDAQIFHKSLGGDTLNVLVAASRLGSRTGYITRIGEDHFAPYLLQRLLNERIDLSMIKVTPGYKNGIYFVSVFDGGGQDYISYREGSAASILSADDLEASYLSAASYLYVSGVTQAISGSSRNAVYEACRLIDENKTGFVSYDPYFRSELWPDEETAKAAFQEILPYTDVLFLKHPFESEQLTGISDTEQLIEALWRQGVRVVALKLGGRGCIVGERQSGDIGSVEAIKIDKVIDRNGAGDAFCGAFLHGLTRGFDIFQSARIANITAGLKMAGRGTITSLPSGRDVYRIFEAA